MEFDDAIVGGNTKLFTLERIIFKKTETDRNQDHYVHPFYKTAFCRLYEMEESEVKAEEGVYPRDNYEFLIPIVRELADGKEGDITHFYDVRTTEEFLQTAPEYALLKGAGIQKASPLGVKGMDAFALPFALMLAEKNVEENKMALILCAEIYVPADGEVYGNSMKRCCGFLLRKDSLEQVKGTTRVLAYRFHVNWEEVRQYREECCWKSNQTIVYEGDSLLDALEVLYKELNKGVSDFLAIWKHNAKFGFVHIERR